MKNTKADKETVLALLRAIIDYECSKPYREIDSEFVSKCVDYIYEIEGFRRLTQDEIKENVREIFAKCDGKHKADNEGEKHGYFIPHR